MKQKTPTDWKRCATCTYWGGTRYPADPFLSYVEHDDNGEGKCYKSQLPMKANAACPKWEQQYRKQ